MNTAITQEELAQILDQALQEVTECTAGVRLHQGDQPPGEDLCTVHITFDKGFSTSLTLCADKALLARMARNSFHEDAVTAEDLEEFSKEYLNVLSGRRRSRPTSGSPCSITAAMSPRGRRCSSSSPIPMNTGRAHS